VHVFGIAHAAFDQADVAGPHLLDVGEGRAVELDQFDEFEEVLVDVEKGHVAAEAAGQGGGGDTQLAGRGAHDSSSLSFWLRMLAVS
jgi:hypothetical protein